MKNRFNMTLFWLAALPLICQAAPINGVIERGNATINHSGDITTITQTSSRATINWDSFNVASSERINFIQPSTQSATLNNIADANPSMIAGSITANGQVFLSNPNGFIFSAGSSINVGSLLATSSLIDNFDDSAAHYSAGGTGSITSAGTFTSSAGGFIAFFAPTINNQASITSPTGNIVFSDTSRGTVYLPNSAGIGFHIESLESLNAINITNSGALTAQGGQIILSSTAIDSTLRSAINNSGALDVSGISSNGGIIRLTANQGSIQQNSRLNADAASNGDGGSIIIIADQTLSAEGQYTARGGDTSGNGGFIETSGLTGAEINAKISTSAPHGSWGEWLIDPINYTIGNAVTSADNLNVVDLITSLASTNISVSATSNLTVLDSINSTGAGMLTLTAPRVEIQANIISAALTIDGAFIILSADLTSSGNILFLDSTVNSTQQNLLLATDSTIRSDTDIRFTNSRTYGNSNSLNLSAVDIYGVFQGSCRV